MVVVERSFQVGWTWNLEPAESGGALSPDLDNPDHSTQSDAESWLGENWPDLLAAGVAQASLMRDGELIYGPMSLAR